MKAEPKSPVSGDIRLSFAYLVIAPAGRETGLRDPMGRRVLKTVDEYNGSSWSATAVTKFVWDGWLLVAELDGFDSDPVSRSRGAATGAWAALVRTYTWGLDLSRTIHGAGGIGGLLAVDKIKGTKYAALCVYPVIPPAGRETGLRAYDGNPASGGGMCQVIDAEDGSLAAHYEYDPYGREIVATGDYAEDNPWRFSTKYLDPLDPGDPDAALLYYGYRSYSPRLGRWMRRDPIEEQGGGNLYRFILNCPVGHIDPDGRQTLHIWGNWCGPGYCGNGRNPGCEGNPAFWATAALYPVVDRLDRCCRDHDSCLGQVEWDWGSGSWVRDPHPNSPYGCDNELCLCARSTAAGGSPHRRRARAGIICLFCFIEVHAP